MKLLVLYVSTVVTSLPNVHFFVRSNHPKVRFHQHRLENSFEDLKRQVEEFSLANRVKYGELSEKGEQFYQGIIRLKFWISVMKFHQRFFPFEAQSLNLLSVSCSENDQFNDFNPRQ